MQKNRCTTPPDAKRLEMPRNATQRKRTVECSPHVLCMAFSMARQNPIESHTTLVMYDGNKHTAKRVLRVLWLPTGGPWALA